MNGKLDRRTFTKAMAAGLGLAGVLPAGTLPTRNIKIGHTGITWSMPLAEPAAIERGIREMASLGYHGIELFGANLQALEANGETLLPLLEKYNVRLISGYLSVSLTNVNNYRTSLDRLQEWGRILKKAGATVAVFGPNAVPRKTYDFSFSAQAAATIAAAMFKRPLPPS